MSATPSPASTTKRAILVTGERFFAEEMLKRQLASVGVEIVDAWTKRVPTGAQPDVDFLLLLVDMCGHHLTDQTITVGKKYGVPVIRGTRKWSHLRNQLAAAGFVNDNAGDTNTDDETNDEEDDVQHETSYRTVPGTPWALFKRGIAWRLQDTRKSVVRRSLTLGPLNAKQIELCSHGIAAVHTEQPAAAGLTMDDLFLTARANGASHAERQGLVVEALLQVAARAQSVAPAAVTLAPLAPVEPVEPVEPVPEEPEMPTTAPSAQPQADQRKSVTPERERLDVAITELRMMLVDHPEIVKVEIELSSATGKPAVRLHRQIIQIDELTL